jgi:hypothetical protein
VICGAPITGLYFRGEPCSRRVRVAGDRCVQHGGESLASEHSRLLAQASYRRAKDNEQEQRSLEEHGTVALARRLGLPANEAFKLVHFLRYDGRHLFDSA